MINNKFKIIIIIIIIAVYSICCKKKTTIDIQVFNPLLQEYVSGAKVVLVEKEENGGIFNPKSTCLEIAECTTDNNGNCYFDKEKLKTKNKISYFCAIKESWGVQQSYPCTGKSSGFLIIGETNQLVLLDDINGEFAIQYNNLFNPSINGDSLVVIPKRLEFPNPKGGAVGGGGVSGGGTFVSNGNNNYPAVFSNTPDKLSGIIVINIRKRKLGVLSLISDTIKAYPNKFTKAQINW